MLDGGLRSLSAFLVVVVILLPNFIQL